MEAIKPIPPPSEQPSSAAFQKCLHICFASEWKLTPDIKALCHYFWNILNL